jgi:hypothetical protein
VTVLVDTVTPARAHAHDDAADGDDAPARDERPRLSGRTRGNKLVHLAGTEDLLGREVPVRVEHAGPYALRGSVTREHHAVIR